MHIFIAQLSRGSIDTRHLDCLAELQRYLDERGCDSTLARVSRRTNIPAARNLLAAEFLKNPEHDLLLWVDDDMTFRPDEMTRMCLEACQLQAIVGAAYASKTLPAKLMVDMLPHTEKFTFFEGGSVQRVAGVGTGLVAIPSSVFKALARWAQKSADGVVSYYDPLFEGGVRYGEDIAFCRRAAKVGVSTYCDSRVRAGHIGTYEYHVEDCFGARHRYSSVKFEYGAGGVGQSIEGSP